MPAKKIALVNGRVVLSDAVTQGKAVIIDAGTIVDVVDAGALGSDIDRIDVGGRYITPGLIDLHTHGALGHTFNEPTAEAFRTICNENAQRGVTGLLATLATAPMDDLTRCLEFGRGWMKQAHSGARVLGMHLESPYISLAQKGALDPANIRTPDDGSVEALLPYSDVLKIFVLAPELPGAIELTRQLTERGVLVAAGHSSAKDEQVLAAMRAGLKHVTHIWSAMSMVVREGPWRKPGLLESALTFDGLSVEMIADNKHLPATLMKLAYKCIGADRLCVISDATSGAGLPEGARFKMGGMEYAVHAGVGMMLDRSSFAGSSTLVNEMIPILANIVGIPLIEALRMLTLTPARVLGIEKRKGSINAGKDADLAIFNDDWTAWGTLIAGEWIYQHEKI
jgi:N-acetylglucosamine-6-phosphate deacetylase